MRPSRENFQPAMPVLGQDLVSEAQCCQCSHTCKRSDAGDKHSGWPLPARTKCEIFMEASAGSALSTLFPFKQLLCCIFRTQSTALMKTAAQLKMHITDPKSQNCSMASLCSICQIMFFPAKFGFSYKELNFSISNPEPSFGSVSSDLLRSHSTEYNFDLFRKAFNRSLSTPEPEILTFLIQNVL